MDRPRAHSVMQIRPIQSSFHVRASKFFQKVSSKFTRPPQNPGGNTSTYDGPYMRNSMDAAAKPYMSQPVLGLMLAPVEDNVESDGSESPPRNDVGNMGVQHHALPLPTSLRPTPPSRTPPPPPENTAPKPNTQPSHTFPPSPPDASVKDPLPSRDGPPDFPTNPTRNSYPLRHSHSQTLSQDRNWSRPSSAALGTSVEIVAGLRDAVTPRGSTVESRPSSSHSIASSETGASTAAHPATSDAAGSIMPASSGASALRSVSTISSTGSSLSSTSSYATALSGGSAISTSLTAVSGLPVLPRHAQAGFESGASESAGVPASSVSGLPPTAGPFFDGSARALPLGAARAVDPHAYSPKSDLFARTTAPPRTTSPALTAPPQSHTSHDGRRVSVASFASTTSVDSFATAQSAGWTEGEEDGTTPSSTPSTHPEPTLVRRDTLRAGEGSVGRERADTLRPDGKLLIAGAGSGPSVSLNSPSKSAIARPAVMTDVPAGMSSNAPGSTTQTAVNESPADSVVWPARSSNQTARSTPPSTPTPTNSSSITLSSSSPTTSASPAPVPSANSLPPEPKSPVPLRTPARAASLPPITLTSLVIPTAPVPALPPPGSVTGPSAVDASVALSPSLLPSLWGNAPATISPRTRTASAGYSHSSSSPRGTFPVRRPPSIPLSPHQFNMTFNPGSPSRELGRFSPSIIVRQPPLAIPVVRLPSVSAASPSEPTPTSPDTVGRRSSVIF
ncbi:hypothetical protein GGX14DRAFT_697370, partial [Mycena pura]